MVARRHRNPHPCGQQQLLVPPGLGYLRTRNGDGHKIATQITHQPDTFTAVRNIETTLNDAGYQLLAQKKTKEAIELFKLNTQFYPDSANTYDSLGEAQALDGDKTEAIENYEKSIALNPRNEHGKAALAKLKE